MFVAGFSHAQQQQQVADSLRKIYEADTLVGVDKMVLLEDLSYHEMSDPDQAQAYVEELIAIAGEVGNKEYLYTGYIIKGHIGLQRNDLDFALKAYQKAMEIAEQEGDKEEQALALMYQGSVYSDSGEQERAIAQYTHCIELLRDPEIQEEGRGKLLLASTLLNLGYIYLKQDELEKASNYFQETWEMNEGLESQLILPYLLGNRGMLFARQGDLARAEEFLSQAIQLLETDGNYDPIAEYQITLAEVYRDEGEFNKAHDFATEGLGHSQNLGKKELISRASGILAQLDYQSGDFKEAFEHQTMYMQFKDSLDVETVSMNRLERAQAELAALQATNELTEKELQQRKERTALWAVGVTALVLIIITIGGYGRYHYMRKTSEIISRERDRAENLLLNILPKQTAAELKDNGKVEAQRYNAVSVLFTDFRNFTKHAEEVDPGLLVKSLDYYFSYFDTLMDKYGLEKIKTVGDAYMCASGIPFPVEDHAQRIVDAALEMLDFVEEAKKDMDREHIRFDIRIGINSGPVVAGIVGTKKFAYDIWGDTVNIAARMESASVPGKVNVAEHTYQLIKDRYQCQYRGEIEAKNRGKLKMYFVSGKKDPSEKAPKRNEPVLAD